MGYYWIYIALWCFFLFLIFVAVFSCASRRNRPPQPTAPTVMGGTPYMVTRSPTRQPQGQVHMVDGIVVPAWVAQEQAQQAQQRCPCVPGVIILVPAYSFMYINHKL